MTSVRERIDVIDHPDAERQASPSSTVVLVRDGADELEVLMIRRGADTAFGGMWAFPGGVIEHEDIPDGTEPDPIPAARRAAVREAQEEVGLTIAEDSLVWWSHWLPPTDTQRRFSTWFFIAEAHDGHADEHIGIDESEIDDHLWVAPAVALGMHERDEILLAAPTFVTLEQIHRYGDVSSVVSAANPFHFATEIAFDSEGVRVCLWQGDAGYGTGKVDADGPRRRLEMNDDAGWRWLDTAG